jgi:hypothetical protein
MQQPVVGTWYVNPTGKTFRIRLLAYAGDRPSDVLIEYAEGTTHLVSIADWRLLDLDVSDPVRVTTAGWRHGKPPH